MKYSFIIIAFNEEKNIINCIKSIHNQELHNNEYEILIVDDGSTDNTIGLVTSLMKNNKRIRLISDGENHGRGYSRYVGVNSSKGEVIAMIDADIILPNNWLTICEQYFENFDVVGGIAVPDGDVAYLFNRFKLEPRPIEGSTTITGNNGLYKRNVFRKINFDKYLREGEDIDFNHKLVNAEFKSKRIPNLIVYHNENKSFLTSLRWLFQSGIGATRQLLLFKEVRFPDLAFFSFMLSTILTCLLTISTRSLTWIVLPLFFTFTTSLLHFKTKFYFSQSKILSVFAAIVINTFFIFSYFMGRTIGFVIFFKNNRHYKTN